MLEKLARAEVLRYGKFHVMNESGQPETAIKSDIELNLAGFGRNHPEIIRLVLFGSVARGDAHAASDVDIMATFAPGWKRDIDGLDYFSHLDGLERDLAATLGRPAHLVDCDAVKSGERIGNKSLGCAIARDGQLIYDADHTPEGCARPHR